jgi:Kef-type K+ transport system membrane component KefB
MAASPETIMYITIFLMLFFFGLAYNAFVAWLGPLKEGYTALLVVVGVLVTLLGVALIDWRAAVLVGGAFAASGTPMIIGDISRTIKAREKRERIEMLIKAASDDTEKTTS